MNYLSECDLPIKTTNMFKIPLFLFSNRYKKLSADAKLLYSLMLDELDGCECDVCDLEKNYNYSPALTSRCIRELSHAELLVTTEKHKIILLPPITNEVKP